MHAVLHPEVVLITLLLPLKREIGRNGNWAGLCHLELLTNASPQIEY